MICRSCGDSGKQTKDGFCMSCRGGIVRTMGRKHPRMGIQARRVLLEDEYEQWKRRGMIADDEGPEEEGAEEGCQAESSEDPGQRETEHAG